jgi:hypothetical protein
MYTCVDCGKSLKRYARQCGECYRKNRNHAPIEWACIDCGAPVGRKVKRCQPCGQAFLKNRPTYERTPEHKDKMKSVTSKPKPYMVGRAFPHRNAAIASAWTDEMREAARERGKRYAQDREWLERIAKAVSGENNPMWQGGIANAGYAPGFCKSLKLQIRTRDNFTCQLCGMNEQELGYTLSIHHSDYDKTNHSPTNLFATCKRCNSFVNTRRDFWQAYFADLAELRQL